MPRPSSATPHIDVWVARQSGCPCHLFRLSVLAQVSGHISHLAASQSVLLVVVLVVVVVVALLAAVALTAVWSGKPARRKVALAVLDRLLRWRH
jgi:threonine/homoserine/homoserine lactone efflux protein